ncbi:hypothetical protein [Spirilliplanes yamanashiensis]|uniref:Uncharacterized protein n=1 Tax=Spirilliplanes yamanashiensis TaxID=42233 RepID=A0A8J3YCW5_9ACTN|nr:hypothetical protein [Spirilliplanes yamanashiensis]MDP9818493.1 hypothetical protein [Spirilliplanes yamanashiensis]GIJ06381.1 hypothetical protein Sya03_57330 [Spirilliplanes yamanashiensis]
MTGLLSGARQAIGQYFSLVSFLPSLFLVTYCSVLISSGGLTGPPDHIGIRDAVSELDLGGAAALTLVSLAVSVVMHPLQYMMVQLAEGYWGLGALSRRMRSLAVDRHRRRRAALYELRRDAKHVRGELERLHKSAGANAHQELLSLHFESSRLSSDYPDSADNVMPTRLGNVLRRYEVGAGEPFGLPASALLPLVGLVAPDTELNYLNDRRSAMDLAVRTAAIFGIAFVLNVALFWDDGLWLLTALIPYTFAYVSYRGAIVQAHDYGNAMTNIVAMNRFTVYERLHLELPNNVLEERDLHQKLRPMFDLQPLEALRYQHPAPPPFAVGPAMNAPAGDQPAPE